MRIAKAGYIVISLVFFAAGLLLIMRPDLMLGFLGTFFGVAMLVFGAVKLVGYFSKDLYRLAFQYDLQFGILLLILGFITLIRPRVVPDFICVASGICLTLDGLFKCRTAREAEAFGIRSWQPTFAAALLVCAAGTVLIFNAYEAARFAAVLFGAALAAEGILNLCVAVSMVKIVRNQLPDIVEADITDYGKE